jgi:hypothetical protein
MTDRELLELAAKAAGIECWYQAGLQYFGSHTKPTNWNPLVSDHDALRLAVKLYIGVEVWAGSSKHGQGVTIVESDSCTIEQVHGKCPYAATRRAIVRAAAEIGRTV